MDIREVKVHELPLLLEGARGFVSETKFGNGFSDQHFLANWQNFLESGTGVIFGLFEGEKCGGAIAGLFFPDIYSGELAAQEAFWYVLPEHRKGSWGIRLLERFERLSKELGCRYIRMAHLSDSMPERLESLYVKRGYVKVETLYQREVTP